MEYNLEAGNRASNYALPFDIQRRAEDMFYPKDGQTPNLQEHRYMGERGLLGNLQGFLEKAMGPTYYLGTQQLFDYGIDYFRQKKIDAMAGDSTVTNSYDYDTNRYKAIPREDRVFYGILDDDVTKTNVNKQGKSIRNSTDAQALRKILGREGAEKILLNKGSLTDPYQIESQAEEIVGQKNLTSEINKMYGGQKALKDEIAKNGGKPLSSAQLNALKTEVAELNPLRVDQRADSENLRTTRTAQATAATTNAGANALNAQTGVITARNNAAMQQAQIDFNNRKLEYDYNVANTREQNRVREANLDRTLRKDLAVLGLEDRREGRRYDAARDERKDRQMLILQLMQGLSNLGRNIAI